MPFFLLCQGFLDDVVKPGVFFASLTQARLSGAVAAAYIFSAWFRKVLLEGFGTTGPSMTFDATTFSTCNSQR